MLIGSVFDAEIRGSTKVAEDPLHSREMRGTRIQTELRYSLNCKGNVGSSTDGGVHKRSDHMLIETFDLGVRFRVGRLDEFDVGVHGCGDGSAIMHLEPLKNVGDVLRLAQKN
jgi:hypothetical protein